MLKKHENRNQTEPRTGFLQFCGKTKKVCRCFANFSSEQEHFTYDMCITALIRTSDVNKSNRSCYDAKVFRHSIACATAVFVTSRSSSFEYTMSVHAVHAERNVCNIVLPTETPHSTTNPSQTLIPVYKLAHLLLPHSKSLPPRPHNL